MKIEWTPKSQVCFNYFTLKLHLLIVKFNSMAAFSANSFGHFFFIRLCMCVRTYVAQIPRHKNLTQDWISYRIFMVYFWPPPRFGSIKCHPPHSWRSSFICQRLQMCNSLLWKKIFFSNNLVILIWFFLIYFKKSILASM